MREFYVHTTIYMKMEPNETVKEATTRCWKLIHSVGLDCGDLCFGEVQEYPLEITKGDNREK